MPPPLHGTTPQRFPSHWRSALAVTVIALRIFGAGRRRNELPEEVTWIWTDGSVDGAVRNGGGG